MLKIMECKHTSTTLSNCDGRQQINAISVDFTSYGRRKCSNQFYLNFILYAGPKMMLFDFRKHFQHIQLLVQNCVLFSYAVERSVKGMLVEILKFQCSASITTTAPFSLSGGASTRKVREKCVT